MTVGRWRITTPCLTHRPPRPGKAPASADPGYRTCRDCHTRIHERLSPLTVTDDGWPDSIPGLYLLLNPRPGTTGPGRRCPGWGSRSPANDHVITMRDRRTTRDHRQPLAVSPHSVPGTLGSWCQSLADARRRIRPPTDRSVSGLAAYLDTHLDWITRQEWVADLATELRELHAQLYRGRHDWRPIGDCPVLTDTGTCGATLLACLDLGTVRCWVCGAEWACDKWLHLGSVLTGA